MKSWAYILAIVLAGGLCGCLERDIKIDTEPEGAIVMLNDIEVGRTPVTVPFTWYGDYDVLLRLDGYKTLVTHAHINPPAYEYPPIDLFCQLLPVKYQDHRYLNFKMDKLVLPDDQTLIKRADTMKEENLQPVK